MSCPACGKGRKKNNPGAPVGELNLPQPSIWGPALWTILHVAAEKAGQNSVIGIRLDEVRELEMLVRTFPQALPCAICQQHAGEYINSHKLTWSGKVGHEAKEEIRRWFYDFHDHVNRNKSTPTISIPYETVESTYSGVTNVSLFANTINEQITGALNFNIVKHEAARRFRRHLGSLRSFIGI